MNWKNIKNKLRRVGAGLLFGALVLTNLGPIQAKAEELKPQFNFLPQDKELFRGANLGDINKVEDDQATPSDPVSGKVGDVFSGVIFYHNGVVDTTAQDVKIKVSAPAATVNKTARFNATISSATPGVSSVSDMMTLNLNDADGNIAIEAGSVKWFPNFLDNPDPQNPVSTPLPFGQNGSELFASGLRIGDIRGCFEFAGYVTFRFTVLRIPGQPEFLESKTAKNLSTGEEGTDIKANPGDEVLYTLRVKNVGESGGLYQIIDDVADILEYANVTAISDGGQLSGGKITYFSGTIVPNATMSRTFKAKVMNPLPTNPQSGEHFDFVMKNVFGNAVLVRLPRPQFPALSINKWVRDVTVNETEFKKENVAKAGDILEYKIEFGNTGSVAAISAKLFDVLPANTEYVADSTIISRNGSTERALDNGIAQDGLTINIDPGEKSYVKFRVKTSTSIAPSEILLNKAFLRYGNDTLQSEAKTRILEVPVFVQPAAAAPTQAPQQLPVTGAASTILVSLLGVSGWLSRSYLLKRKALKVMLKNF